MRRLFDQCQSRMGKDWVQFPLGMHNDTCMQTGYFTAVGNFLKGRVLPQKSIIQAESIITEEEIKMMTTNNNNNNNNSTHNSTHNSNNEKKKGKKYGFQGRRKSTHW